MFLENLVSVPSRLSEKSRHRENKATTKKKIEVWYKISLIWAKSLFHRIQDDRGCRVGPGGAPAAAGDGGTDSAGRKCLHEFLAVSTYFIFCQKRWCLIWQFAPARFCLLKPRFCPCQAPPNVVSMEDRRSSEAVFMDFRKTRGPFALCRFVNDWLSFLICCLCLSGLTMFPTESGW